jgi:hypothetical protein
LSIRITLTVWLLSCILFGCSRGPKAVERPKIDAAQMAASALQQLDADGDGTINSTEANRAPGLAAAFKRTDTNQDGSLTADEISQRLEAIVSTSPAMVNFVVELSSQGQPVEGAIVTVLADDFLGNQFPKGNGTTDEFGIASITMAKEDMPFEGAPEGIRPGLYRIEVQTQGKNVTPPVAGVEVSMDAPTLRTTTFKVSL